MAVILKIQNCSPMVELLIVLILLCDLWFVSCDTLSEVHGHIGPINMFV